jgi:MFS transporter, PAT family, beta-lactamase induction signal transducer AmpG
VDAIRANAVAFGVVAAIRNFPALIESQRLRFATLTAFYFAQGVPIGLLDIALPAWLVEQGYSPAEIGSFLAAIGLPWVFKLVAGPFMDRYQFLAMGRRRPWIIGAQAGLMLALAVLGLFPVVGGELLVLMAIGFMANTFTAAQDVAVDGLAIDVLPERERGRANGFMMFGQVAGIALFGGLSGVLLARYGLTAAALVAAAAVSAVFLFALLARERPGEKLLPWSGGQAHGSIQPPPRSLPVLFGDLLRVLVLPMSLLMMLVTVLARSATGMALVAYPVVAVDRLGHSAEVYSTLVSSVYMAAAVAALGVGLLVDRFGAKQVAITALVIVGTTYAVFGLTPQLWASNAYVIGMFVLVELSVQTFMIAMIAQHMNITWVKVAATQFAIYMAISNLGRSAGAAIFAALSGLFELPQLFLVIAAVTLLASVVLVPFRLSGHQLRLQKLAVAEPAAAAA